MNGRHFGRPRPGAGIVSNLRAWWGTRSPLARDLTVILIVKAGVLALLWFAFFRTPAAPHMAMEPRRVGDRLITPSPLTSPAAEVPRAVH